MLEPISEEQFRTAQDLLARIRRLIDLRNRLVEQGKLKAELALPSLMWEPVELVRYFLNPTRDIINTLRWHTYLFSGFHLSHAINNGHNPPPESMVKKYHKLTNHLPDEYIGRPPRMLGEIGWEINGGVINKDVLMYQRHLTTLYDAGVFDYLKTKDSIRVLEIGPGYGGLAYFLYNILKPSAFYFVDLAESLAFSSVYMTLARGVEAKKSIIYDGSNTTMLNVPKDSFVFIPNFLASDLRKMDKFDFVVNTGSFGEMNKEQVAEYADIIKDTLTDNGILFEDNGNLIPVSETIAKWLHGKKIYKNKTIWTKRPQVLGDVKQHSKHQNRSENIINRFFTKALKT